jgi:hypothetical protein
MTTTYTPCETIRYQQTAADREAQDILAGLADAHDDERPTMTTTSKTTISSTGFVLTTKSGTFAVLYDALLGRVADDVLVRGQDGLFRLTYGSTPVPTTVAQLGRKEDVKIALIELAMGRAIAHA